MPANSYTPEQRAADLVITKAMGWQIFPYMMPGETEETTLCCPPDVKLHASTAQPVPRFHESHDARAALLEWLAADGGRWQAFIFQFYLAGPEDLRAAFLATPAQVAAAALRVIKEGE